MPILPRLRSKGVVLPLILIFMPSGPAAMMLARAGKPTSPRRFGIPVRSMAFSPDGSLLACTAGGSGKTLLIKSDTMETVSALADKNWNYQEVGFLASGKTLVAADMFGKTHLLDPRSGKSVRKMTGVPAGPTRSMFSNDGSRYVTGDGIQAVTIRDFNTGSAIFKLKQDTAWVHPVAFSPD